MKPLFSILILLASVTGPTHSVANARSAPNFLSYCEGKASKAETRVVAELLAKVGETDCKAGFQQLQKLESLDLSMRELTTAAPLVGLSNLRSLDIAFNRISDLRPIGSLQKLQFLNIHGWRAKSLDPISSLTKLQHLDACSKALKDIDAVANFAELHTLHIEYATPTNLGPLAGLENLRELWLGHNSALRDLSPLSNLRNLEELRINGESKVTSLAPLAGLSKIKRLSIDGGRLRDVKALASMSNLRDLGLGIAGTGAKIPVLDAHPHLETVHMEHGGLSNLEFLSKATSVEELYLANNRIDSIQDLRALKNLRVVRLSKNRISDIAPLSGMHGLTHLELGGNRVRNVAPIANLKSLVSGFWAAGNPIEKSEAACPTQATNAVGAFCTARK